jgi:hypothetical protein
MVTFYMQQAGVQPTALDHLKQMWQIEVVRFDATLVPASWTLFP